MRRWFGRPTLLRAHPNFFIIYFGTMIFHAWSGYQHTVTPESFDSIKPLHDYVYKDVAPVWWGVANLIIAAGLFIGLHVRRFDDVARVFLAVGMLWCLLRFSLLVWAWSSGEDIAAGLPVMALIATLHFTQTLEPPSNPANSRT